MCEDHVKKEEELAYGIVAKLHDLTVKTLGE